MTSLPDKKAHLASSLGVYVYDDNIMQKSGLFSTILG